MKTKQYTIDEMIDQAVIAERERCAQVADEVAAKYRMITSLSDLDHQEPGGIWRKVIAQEVAAGIRARSNDDN